LTPISKEQEPIQYNEAIINPKWYNAMEEELEALEKIKLRKL
jgi:hypothetical protein